MFQYFIKVKNGPFLDGFNTKYQNTCDVILWTIPYLDGILSHVFDFDGLVQVLVAAEFVFVNCFRATEKRDVWKKNQNFTIKR